MLRTNLATRPFYHERLVQAALVAVAGVGLAVLAAGLVRLGDLARRDGDLSTRLEQADGAAAGLAAGAAEAQRALTPQDLTALADAARETDVLIAWRGFSWTDFFNRIETTLPPDVMVTEVRPEIEPDQVEVAMGVLGRSLDAIDRFVTALESSGAFVRVLNRQVELTEDGMYQAVLRGRYLDAAPPGGDPPGSDSPEGDPPGSDSPEGDPPGSDPPATAGETQPAAPATEAEPAAGV